MQIVPFMLGAKRGATPPQPENRSLLFTAENLRKQDAYPRKNMLNGNYAWIPAAQWDAGDTSIRMESFGEVEIFDANPDVEAYVMLRPPQGNQPVKCIIDPTDALSMNKAGTQGIEVALRFQVPYRIPDWPDDGSDEGESGLYLLRFERASDRQRMCGVYYDYDWRKRELTYTLEMVDGNDQLHKTPVGQEYVVAVDYTIPNPTDVALQITEVGCELFINGVSVLSLAVDSLYDDGGAASFGLLWQPQGSYTATGNVDVYRLEVKPVNA